MTRTEGTEDPFADPERPVAGLTRGDLLRRATAAGALLALPAGLSGLTPLARAHALGGAPRRGGVLNMARNEEPLSFDPVVPADNGSVYAIQQVFDQLVRVNAASTGIAPALAESWQISPNKRTYTFRLRSNARFSTGAPVTADDVVFSLKRTIDPDVCPFAFLFGIVKNVRSLNTRTVQITLSEPSYPFLTFLAVFAAAIVPRNLVAKDPKGFAVSPVGSGAFAVKSFESGRLLHLVRNPYYWQRGKPYLDEVIINYVPDDNSRVLKLQAGEVDVATTIPYAQIATVNSGDTRVLIEPLFRWDGIWLNHNRKPISDRNVRQALNYATDKKTLVDRVLFGHAEVANAMMQKHLPYWSSNVKAYPYDIERAKRLIESSTVPQGFSANVVVPAGDTLTQQVAQVVKASWAQIGVNITIQNLDVGTAVNQWVKGNYTIGSNWYGTSDVPSPDEAAQGNYDLRTTGPFHSGFSWYRSEKSTALVERAKRSFDVQERVRLFRQLQQVLMDDAWGVALFFTSARTGITDRVQNFHTYRTGWWALEQVWLNS